MRILALCPHTDDGELGAGATIAKYLRNGHEVHYAVFSVCEDSLPTDQPRDQLKQEFLAVLDHLAIPRERALIRNYPVRSFPQNRQKILEDMIELRTTVNPDIVIALSLHDYHQDHKVIVEEAIRAFKNKASIWCYELPWNHVQFDTQHFESVSEQDIVKKIEALQKYKSQIDLGRPYFREEFVRGLASVRGVQCHSHYAEAFEVVRSINR